jgi:hypothetical protein
MNNYDKSVYDAIDDYYILKSKYDNKNTKLKSILISNDKLSMKNKRLKYIKKCIVCNQLGGTLFTRTNKTLFAKCNADKPCKLDIEIFLGIYNSSELALELYKTNIEIIKVDVIETKLELLFNYVNERETIERFESLRDELIIENDKYTKLLKDLSNVISNTDDKTELQESQQILYEEIENIKTLIFNYKTTQDISHIKEATEIYINTILDIVKKIRELKYKFILIDIVKKKMNRNKATEVYSLIQYPYSITDIEIALDDKQANIIKNNH